MSYNPNNPNGQATKANSAPVVIASDQATSLADGIGAVGLGMSMIATNFVLSAVNSSTVQLAAAATFTGGIESIYNQQCISVLLTSDQNGTLTLNQYIDAPGARKISAYVYTIVAGIPFSRNVVGNGNYFNAVFVNNGGSTTTTFNLNIAYGTLPSATNLGNSPVSIDEVNGTALTLGQKTITASIPVVIASNQSAINTITSPATSGGLSVFHLVSAATTNATVVKSSAGQVFGWFIYNSNAAARKVSFHNLATTPTAGASVFMTLVIPPGSGANVEMSNGIQFTTGIGITTVTDLTDAGTTAVALNDLNINIFYK